MVSADSQRELDNAIASVRASFRALETSGSRLDRQAARTKEKFLTQILGAHHARQQALASYTPRSNNAGLSYTPRPPGGIRAVEHPYLGAAPVSLGGCAEEDDGAEEIDGSDSSSGVSDSEYWNLLEAGAAIHIGRRPTMSSIPSTVRRNGVVVRPPTASAANAPAAVATAAAPSGSKRPTTAGTSCCLREAAMLGSVQACPGSALLGEGGGEPTDQCTPARSEASSPPRACTPRVQLRVAAKRPFSAPGVSRWVASPQARHVQSVAREQREGKAGSASMASGAAAVSAKSSKSRPAEKACPRVGGAGASPELHRPGSPFAWPPRPRRRCTRGTRPRLPGVESPDAEPGEAARVVLDLRQAQ